jgi:YVTN family beta-propeller protein
MENRSSTHIRRAAVAAAGVIAIALFARQAKVGAENSLRFDGPISSQNLALSADDGFLAVVNPDNNTVSLFDVRDDRNQRLAQVPVQNEPNGVTFSPDGTRVYVANTVSGTVSIIPVDLANGWIGNISHIPVGTEPYALAMTPNGTKLYVANARSNNISVIDTYTNLVVATISSPDILEPRGLAITNDGDGDDNDETLYVTNFLSTPIPGKIDGTDDSKAALVAVIPTATDTVSGFATINPIADSGFKALGDAIARIPPGDPANAANFKFVTGAYPNQLNTAAIKGNFLYLPNTGASPNGPFRFDVNTQSLLSVVNRITNQDADKTINMHLAVSQQTNPVKRFITQPWSMAFKHLSNEGWVLSAASNIAVKVRVDPTTGAGTVQRDPVDNTRVHQVIVGKNPRGIVINTTDTRAYVMNYVGRDVSVMALAGGPERVIATMQSAGLPQPGTQADKIHAGRELYFTSIGEFDRPTPFQPPITGRMSNNGWGSCGACHPFGTSDGVVWIFPGGPRRVISQHTDFDLTDPDRKTQRVLNWSGERDEEEDFDLNIRAVSGGQGLIVNADGVTPDPNVANFTPLASGGRNQLKIRGVGAWDAIKAFEQFGIRSPISPVSKTDPDVIAGEALFRAANCQQCHGGPQWTSSKLAFTPPPAASLIVNGQVISELRNVGTFDPTVLNEVRNTAAAPLGADGFVPPSLLGVFAVPRTFLHNGAATTLDAVLENVQHRQAGTGTDTLTNESDRAKLVKFLLSIDPGTPPIQP